MRDITLYHEPSDDVNSLLKLKIARHIRQNTWRTRRQSCSSSGPCSSSFIGNLDELVHMGNGAPE